MIRTKPNALSLLVLAVALGLATWSPIVSAQDATPAPPVDSTGERTSLDLLNALLTTPFPVDVLPEGYADPFVSPWEYGDSDLDGAIGGVIVHLNSDELTGISYVVYPTSQAAESRYSPSARNPATPDTGSGQSNSTRIMAAYDDYAVCGEVVDFVLVIGGVSLAAGADPDAGIASACTLVDSGIAHLNQVREFETVAVPTAQAIAGPLDQLNILLNSPFPAEILPADYFEPKLVVWEYGDDDLTGAIGGAFIFLNGGDELGIGIRIYASPYGAEAWIASDAISAMTPVARNEASPEAGSWQSAFSTDGYVVCVQRQDNVLVTSVIPIASGETVAEAAVDACELVSAGIEHVNQIGIG